MASRIIDIATEFSIAPGPRFAKHGAHSGEEFRRDLLAPAIRAAIRAHETVSVKLDGAAGYGGSFLEEAFGGLVRLEGIKHDQLAASLEIVADSPAYKPFKDMALKYIRDAKPSELARA